MIGKDVESEDFVSIHEVKKVLEERKKQKELTYEQQLAYDHAKKFSSLDKSSEDKIIKALAALDVKGKPAIKIVDVLPKNLMTLKQILAHENRNFSDAELEKIMAIIKENV
ncbi:MAG: RNA polymerase Rpb4 family protein [Candidatus Marsarchaeota archaeon]|nr:RNA polymerase Rpb4 family protein [Candidatus Marsarchaeota archaeon]